MESKMMGWKIVDEEYNSYMIWGGVQVHCPLNVEVSAPEWLAKDGYHIPFFKTKKAAANWLHGNKNFNQHKIVKIKARGIIDPHLCFLDGRHLVYGQKRKSNDPRIEYIRDVDFIPGMLMAKYITRLTD